LWCYFLFFCGRFLNGGVLGFFPLKGFFFWGGGGVQRNLTVFHDWILLRCIQLNLVQEDASASWTKLFHPGGKYSGFSKMLVQTYRKLYKNPEDYHSIYFAVVELSVCRNCVTFFVVSDVRVLYYRLIFQFWSCMCTHIHRNFCSMLIQGSYFMWPISLVT